jgi:RNA polymerase sigma factor (sigma-70 family)
MPHAEVEDLLRRLAPQVLGAVVRRYGHFDTAEDATQEALIAAARQWPGDGIPDNPRAWLVTVASRRLTDQLRADQARQRREDAVARWVLPEQRLAPPADTVFNWPGPPATMFNWPGPPATVFNWPGPPATAPAIRDDTLILLFMCCHPALTPASQIALTLRAVGGLTTAEIARAFLVPEATMTRRISRAKQQIKDSAVPFRMPAAPERAERLAAVLHVLYLIFTEGYASTSGPSLHRTELAGEAIRLTRIVHRLVPGDGEVTGLLALMLLTDARRAARTGPAGQLIPMAEQDRNLWNAAQITEGVDLVTTALTRGPAGPYQLQAAIAAVHDEAPAADTTDWPQIMALYELLMQLSDNPVVRLNHAVAVAMVRGPRAGLELLAGLGGDERMTEGHQLHAVRAHLLEMAGEGAAAREAYLAAATRTSNLPRQRYLHAQAARLTGDR